jgi:hypothetical protein
VSELEDKHFISGRRAREEGALKCPQASGSYTTSRGVLLQVGNPRIEGGKLGVMGIVASQEQRAALLR